MDTNKMPTGLPTMVKQAITSHPGYPEFSVWCESQLIHPYPIYFLIWQASREAVVVELPDHFRPSRQEIIFAIEAQGLKVAP